MERGHTKEMKEKLADKQIKRNDRTSHVQLNLCDILIKYSLGDFRTTFRAVR